MIVVEKHGLAGAWLVALITLVDTMSSIWFGYCQGVFAGVLVASDFKRLFPQTSDANISGIVTSCFLLAAFFGAILAFILGDKLGRKRTLIVGHTLNLIGATLQFSSWSIAQMIIGRLINGLGIGMTSTMSPVYLAECAPPRLRGRLLIVGASSNVAAFCLANWISYGLFFQAGPLQWRFPLAFQLVFPCVVFPILTFVPESPRWLLLVDRDEQALEVIARLFGAGRDNLLVTSEYRSIKAAIQLERDSRVPVMDVLCHRDKTRNLRRLILSCGTQLMQQFSGINALGFYLPTLLHENVGYNEQMSRLLTAVNGTIYLVSAFGSLVVIDRVGRRNLMMYGSVLTALCHLIASLCLKAGEDDPSKTTVTAKVTVAMIFLYHFCFGPTWGGVPWVYSAEVNSLGWRTRGAAAATATNVSNIGGRFLSLIISLRGSTCSLSRLDFRDILQRFLFSPKEIIADARNQSTQWIMAFVVVQFTKAGLDNLQWAFYLIFAAFSFSYFPIIYFFYPETAHRTLEDMDQIFIQNPSWFVFGNRQMTQRDRPQAFIDAEKERIAQVDRPSVVELA